MGLAPTTATSALPGTRFFAPQVRIVTQAGEALQIDSQPIGQDVISVTLTQPCSGVGQCEITLNNQRFDRAGTYKIFAPAWRYNALRSTEIGFGSRLRVDMRYGQDGWTPMMLVRVNDIAFSFPSGAGASLTLKCEDLVSLLKIKPTIDYNPTNPMLEEDRVREELLKSGCGLDYVGPSGANLFSQPQSNITHKTDKSFLQFIQEFADRMDYEVFAEFDNPGTPLSGSGATQLIPKFHFVPSRCGTLGDPIPIAGGFASGGSDVIDFKPAFKIWDLFTGARVAGNVPTGRGTINTPVDIDEAMTDNTHQELHPAPSGSTPLSASEVRRRAFATEVSYQTGISGSEMERNITTINVTAIDAERARMQGIAALRKSAREFLTAEISTIGYPQLRPGTHINLTGYHAPFDGVYYVTQAVHALSASGYTTRLTVRRPGMLDPAGYPGS